MKPIDFRNTTWADLQERLTGLRVLAWQAWRQHGPGTTREVAARCGMDLLTFRPRTTELFQMGFLRVAGGAEDGHGHEGVYAARTMEEARETFEKQFEAAVQPESALG